MPESHSHTHQVPTPPRASWLLHSGARRLGVALLVSAAVFAIMIGAMALEG